jgi:hypothetical protein
MDSFVEGYNHWHCYTEIGLNTPADVHDGLAAGKALERTKILAIPDTAWINKPAEKANPQVAPQTPTGVIPLDKFRAGSLGLVCGATNIKPVAALRLLHRGHPRGSSRE